ncbi:MAG: SMP-30/gluconolactonase/LRE family protein [Thermomicrobiales bacterium]|nr:SMP-30/gluconolactonase/LRE family protein [Thermomicrobiales bacterium]
MKAERITDAVAYHGEGPVWWPGWGGLKWVDMLAGDVLSLAPSGEVTRWHSGSPVVAAIRPRSQGGMVLGVETGFALANDEGKCSLLPPLWLPGDLRMNEGACDPEGNFWCGSMAYDRTEGAASLWRLMPDGTTSKMISDLTISNGLCWSADGTTAYYNDTETYTISIFDWSPEDALHNRRVFVDLWEEQLRPDGLTVDAEGGVWTGFSNGGAVRRYDASGVLSAVIELPVRKVTACTFGGENLDQLFITTSREGIPDNEQPEAGSLFLAEPGIRGMLPLVFAG